jgi:hypothetical protein
VAEFHAGILARERGEMAVTFLGGTFVLELKRGFGERQPENISNDWLSLVRIFVGSVGWLDPGPTESWSRSDSKV